MSTSVPLILFLHIPKTGGTTLIRILRNAYGPERSIRVQKGDHQENFTEVQRLLRDWPFYYDSIAAHMGRFGVHEALDGQRPHRYLTIFRNPAQRTLSNYYRILRKPSHRRHQYLTQTKTDPLKVIGEMQGNMQTRILAGKQRGEPVTQADLETAKRHLREHFAVPFIIERYADSLVLLKRALGWTRVYTTPPRNVAPNRPRHDDDALLKLAREVNALDMQLYVYGNDLLTRRIRQAGPGYKVERHTFVVKQVLRRRIVTPARRWIKETASSAPPHEDADRDDAD